MTVRQQGGRVVTVVAVDDVKITRTQPPTMVGTKLLDLRLAADANGSAGAVAVTEPEWEALGGDVSAQEALLRARLAHPVPPRTPPPPPPLSAAAAAQQAQQQAGGQGLSSSGAAGSSRGGGPSPAPSKPQARPPAAPQPSAQERQERQERLERESREAREGFLAVVARHQPPPGPAAPQAVAPRRPASRPRPGAPPPPGNAAAA
jgi:hypothetical protein